ncbi:hypothetical protein L227DRAFT_178032 [Lentinus tigrinus ALCF2SS1-6]|uniref:Uncharacterized protein n=1 Tax=Lentinus tigrinus ALCF2SS1-6 TaxID=1328759 RepID=A0A5C2S537_9APHY|nr:hypothetical protein L227DRAFT_178032 [Lentinus tigrinus ALCF2SS1-6]
MCMILPYAATLSQSRFSHAGATFWLSSFELRGWAIRSSRRIRVRGFGCVIPGRGVATRDASSRGVIQVRVWVLSSCTVQASRGLIEVYFLSAAMFRSQSSCYFAISGHLYQAYQAWVSLSSLWSLRALRRSALSASLGLRWLARRPSTCLHSSID